MIDHRSFAHNFFFNFTTAYVHVSFSAVQRHMKFHIFTF